MSDTADVVIIGAGIVGLSIAHQISRRDSRPIVILEKAPNVAEGSTGASSAILRQRYTHTEAILVARDGLRCHRDWAAYTGLEEPRAEFDRSGVLWMMAETREKVEHDRDRMISLGIDAARFDADDVHREFPALSTCNEPFDLTGETGHECVEHDSFLYEADSGFFDPVSAAQDVREAVRRAGVDIRFNTKVAAIRTAGGRVEGVDLADGSSIDAPVVVNAAGPWAPRVAEMAGLEWKWTIRPIRAQVIYREWPRDVVPGPLPVVGDSSSGIYLRPEASGQQILLGSVLHEDEQEVVEDPDSFNNNLDAWFRDTKIHALHHRIPSLPHRGQITGLAGMYTMNVEDVHPIVGPTSIEGFIVANGFSGHGFKESPAVGSMIARDLTGAPADEWDTEAPMGFFSIDRDPIALADTTVLA
ncbi:MAG TPA: FAD-dependent oxidoreductase [Acidimicrobiia bacterium]|nr:FAD-dependent oxidoreductase [Acidimicrobiia bacterium]